MPIGLDSATEQASQIAAQKDDAADAATHNPMSLTTRTKAFCDLVLAVTEKNNRTLTNDQFVDLAKEYAKLEGFERYAAGVELQRVGVDWLITLDDPKDGYDDELNGYDVYTKIRGADGDKATAPQG